MRTSQEYLCGFIIPLSVTAVLTIAVVTMGCGHDTSTPCSVTSAFTTGGETVEGYALFGYTFENVSVTGQFSCWLECQQNCQCVSFNFLTNVKRDNCQLNKEDRFQRPGSMKALHGSQYYDLMTGYRVQGRDQPCLNGGLLRKSCDLMGKFFVCDCAKGFVGQFCQHDCQQALGMESGIISDGQISVSSEWHTGKFGVNMSRLNSPRSWKSGTKDNYQWLQIDLGNPLTTITRVATQGRENSQNPQWVTKYQLQYSVNGINFLYYKEHGQNLPKNFSGNTDTVTIVYNDLSPPIRTRLIRFRPVVWNYTIAMRVELYGC
ncbi:hypothetical protein pdam_00010509, partial [Pocillopora damicornis]